MTVPNDHDLRSDAGLTILELMIVLAILSLIGVFTTVQVVQQMDRAKVDIARLQLSQLGNALELFRIDANRYPSNDDSLSALLTAPKDVAGWRGPYVRGPGVLQDPWGTPIKYANPDRLSYTLTSFGSDGVKGGDGAASDISLESDG